MPRFFIQKEQIRDGFVTVTGADAAHIARVLRMESGEELTVCDEEGTVYRCVITDASEDSVRAGVLASHKADTEPPYRAHLFQAIVKGDKFDTVVQKAVEAGVSEITPFTSERCIARVDGKEEKKVLRWQRIAEEAAKQCGRGIIPHVNAPVSLKEAVRLAAEAELPLFCYEGEGTTPLPALCAERSPETVSILIGPEGGFAPGEVEIARAAGIAPVGLGKRILRTESASFFVLAALSYAFEL